MAFQISGIIQHIGNTESIPYQDKKKKKRDSLNRHSPYELSLLLLDNKLHKALGLKAIAPDDVMLSPKLIK